MRIVSVNVAQPILVQINGKDVLTGIDKQPVNERVWLGSLTLDGDDQADKKVHGGTDQAAYCYPLKHYAHWQKTFALGDLQNGAFGENFTVTEIDEESIHIGDVLQIGGARVQVTKPRIPCFKLAHKIGDIYIVKAFLQSGFSGFYLRVLTEGYVKADDPITIVKRDPQGISVRTALVLQKLDVSVLAESPIALLHKALAIESLTPELHESYTKRLAKFV
jgi:MOSC domain-containing protein YiiM